MTARTALRLTLLATVLCTIGCDRVTKQIASEALFSGDVRHYLADTVRLEYAENTGGFLGLGANLPEPWRGVLFTAATGLVLLLMAGFAVRSRSEAWSLFGACLVFAGGASNWFDRVLRGSVTDFMNIGIGPLRTGIFNVADVSIMLGVSITVLVMLRRSHQRQADRTDA